jgi:hypothetical protein
MRSLKSGGVAVHTTEYNVGDRDTIDNWVTVLYQQKRFAPLEAMMEEAGCRLVDIDFDAGREVFDCYVDFPPSPKEAAGLLSPPRRTSSSASMGSGQTSIAIIVGEAPVVTVSRKHRAAAGASLG